MKKSKKYKQFAAQVLGCNLASYYNWSKSKRPIIQILEKYFDEKDLHHILDEYTVHKFDKLLKIEEIVIKNQSIKYINTFLQFTQSGTLKFASPFFIDFYFNFLLKIEKDNLPTFNFQEQITYYFVDFAKNKDSDKIKMIVPYLSIFNNWDELMSIFLSQNLENNLSILLDHIDNLNSIKKEEVYFHIISLYIYHNYPSLKDGLKVELIKNLIDSVRNNFFTYELLIQFIEKEASNRIKALKEIGLDVNLY